MATTIQTNTYYKDDMIIKETIVDGDIFEIVELYLDEEGEVIYEYKHDYTPGKLLNIRNQILEGSKKLEDYGIQGTLKQIKADERKQQIEKQNKEREKQAKKQKNKEQYNKKLNKKLDKNRKRG
jgi:hypothetical protein